MQVQEAQRVLNKMDAKRPPPRHITITMPKVKDKERLLKAAREKQLVTRKLPDGRGRGRMGEAVRGLRSTNGWLQNSHGDVKYSKGNGEATGLICRTHGHE